MMLALLSENVTKARQRKATVDWSAVRRDWDKYWQQFANETWRKEFIDLLEGVIVDQGEQWNSRLGIKFDVRNILGEKWFDDYTLTFAQPINDTTKADLSALLQQGLQNGWTIDQVREQIGLTFDKYTDPNFTLDGRGLTEEEQKWFEDRSPRYRKELISRTETLRASNSGSFHLFEAYGAEGKEWLATNDARCRPTHTAANGQQRPLDKPFSVGGYEADYPGDPNLPPEEGINCRCTTVPLVTDEQLEKLREEYP